MSSEDDNDAVVEDYQEDETSVTSSVRNRRGTSSSSSHLGHHHANASSLRDIIEEDEESVASKTRRGSETVFTAFYDGNNNSSPVRQRLISESSSIGSPGTFSRVYTPTPKDEYITQLSQWTSFKVMKMYQDFLSASMMASTLMCAASNPGITASNNTNSNRVNNNNNVVNNGMFTLFANPMVIPVVQQNQEVVHKLPRIWKRIAAEGFDFLFLLILKLIATFIAIDYFEIIDLSKFDLSLLEFNLLESSNGTGLDDEDLDAAFHEAYRLAIELTSEIIIIESIHRVIVIVYETIFLMSNMFTAPRPGRVTTTLGASTPGKYIMGLKVVSCYRIEDVLSQEDGKFVRVTPSGDIGFWYSLLRSIIKNFSAVFFIPASLTMFVTKHNRAAYDFACRCIVIEDVVISPGQQRQQ